MTKPIIVVNICYKLRIVCHSSIVKIFDKYNFLASADSKILGRAYLFAMLLLIDLTLFLHPGYFCFRAINNIISGSD